MGGGGGAAVLLFALGMRLLCGGCAAAAEPYVSVAGDPGMRRDGLRVAFEGWNFCNEVGEEAPAWAAPGRRNASTSPHRVTEEDNKLGGGAPFPGRSAAAGGDPDLYAVEKELYLGSLCEVGGEAPDPWQFWMVMVKNGNFDTSSGRCPANGRPAAPFRQSARFPCFAAGCMNQPLLELRRTSLSGQVMRGGFRGTYDLDGNTSSSFEVTWEKTVAEGGWVFRHMLRTNSRYPWLMLYLRADATRGFSGGYHYETRGMLKTVPESPNFIVRLRLEVKRGGGPRSQFYLLDIGGCWKNDGGDCDGDAATDVTRYSEMIINPAIPAWKIHRSDAAAFPYAAYHYYCAPGNAEHLEAPYSLCDPYSNPQPQELVQIRPHPAWKPYGYPSAAGEGWIGDPRAWELDTGRLSDRLYFYQDPGTPPARRRWSSIDVGTEIFISGGEETAEWTLSDFDVLVNPSSVDRRSHPETPSPR
ncbi:unnamed protein product [Spirodela intermedia]|uniref:DUF7705 domain-containing protein n=1 Tax=Spirodela intermedia TaxID=51605 RepID=A0A7I8I866_SPIIN|nr:unnamed protein product [Spirodela intermedia]CAA6653847.1 unnamed protein product [Spirodela intermedia]